MASYLLVLKKRGQKYSIKVTPETKNRYVPDKCDMVVNMQNFKDIALVLHDLETMWNVPIKKAVDEYLKGKKDTEGPFW